MQLIPGNQGTISNIITQKTVQGTVKPHREVCILLTLFVEEGHSPVLHCGEEVNNIVVEIPSGL